MLTEQKWCAELNSSVHRSYWERQIKNKINAATNVEVHVSLLERSSLLQLVKEKNDLLVISEIPTHRTDFFYKIVAYLFYLSISGCKQCQLIHCQKRVWYPLSALVMVRLDDGTSWLQCH